MASQEDRHSQMLDGINEIASGSRWQYQLQGITALNLWCQLGIAEEKNIQVAHCSGGAALQGISRGVKTRLVSLASKSEKQQTNRLKILAVTGKQGRMKSSSQKISSSWYPIPLAHVNAVEHSLNSK